MTWWCNKSNTGRHPFGYLIKYIFCQIVDFQRNHRVSKIVLCGNATSELEQPRQRWRKRENNKSSRFNKQNRNSEHEADFLADLFAVIARLTLSNLIGMAMWSSLKYLGSSFHEQRSSRLGLLRNTHTESQLCIYTKLVPALLLHKGQEHILPKQSLQSHCC